MSGVFKMNTGLLFSGPFCSFAQKNLKTTFLSYLPAVLWTALIYILLVIPGSDLPEADFFDLIYFDKWVHVGLFCILCFLWCLPFMKQPAAGLRLFALIGGCCLLYGVAMEYVQEYATKDRSFSMTDMLADATGCIAGTATAMFWLKRRRLKSLA